MSKIQRRQRSPAYRRRSSPGTAPGTLVVDPASPKPCVHVIAYDAGECVEHRFGTVRELDALPGLVERYSVVWVSVAGLGDAEMVQRLGELFNLHRLALEDVLNNHQRPKVEQYGDHLFIVARMLEGGMRLETDQLGMFLGQKFVVTFQNTPGDCLDPVRERIRRGRGIIRTAGSDYLAYAILDAVVDYYFPTLEVFGEEIEALEESLITNVDRSVLSRIHDVKARLLIVRRAIWPLREALHVLIRDPVPVIQETTRIYLRDCSDHTFQIVDLVETYRELASSLMDLYHSALSNRMNEIMQVLTVIATIFIPLTFIVGVYGMNFDPKSSPWNMPELEWYWGYPAVWAVMLAIAGGMLLFFRHRGWLGGRPAASKRPDKRDPQAGP
ncbi:MAG TPA: magnesium/cobalt transporter CorA [Pirellulales bacterium]